jgi:hypothetical protein
VNEDKCKFRIAWRGPCNEPANKAGYCPEHAKKRCHCGAQATRSCDDTYGLVCGLPLCDTCQCKMNPKQQDKLLAFFGSPLARERLAQGEDP